MKKSKKIIDLMKEIDSYHKRIFDFNKNEYDFIPAKHINPKEEGYYLTIRCGLSGIYQMINEWKNNEWVVKLLDDSYTIAYSREKIKLKSI